MNRWIPTGTENSSDKPQVGDVLALQRGAYKVMHITALKATEEELIGIERYKPEVRQSKFPYRLHLERLHGPKDDVEDGNQKVSLTVPAMAYEIWRRYPEGRIPLCSCCSHPWPCRIYDAAKESVIAGQIMSRKLERMHPGQCYSCGEMIGSRQGSITYPEPNVEIPGYPAPRFHTRKSCADGQYSYERLRGRILPDAPPVLITHAEQVPALWKDSNQ